MIPTATINRKVSGGGGKEKRTKKASSIDPKSRASIVSSIRRGTRKGKAKISRRSFVSTTSHQPATFALNEEPVWCVALWPPQTIHCPRWGPRVSNPIRDGKSRWIGRSADFSPRPLHNGGGSPQSSREGSERSRRIDGWNVGYKNFPSFMHPSNFKWEGISF